MPATSPSALLTRRAALGGAVGCAAAALAGPAVAQQGPVPATRVKGPRVFLDYDQTELDAAYDQRVWAANLQQILKRFESNSDALRARLGAPRRHAYGPTPIEALDVYHTRRPNAPIHIHIHGGAWRYLLAKDFGFPAELFVNAGAHFVVPDFAWVQDLGGSLAAMTEQVRRAIVWTYHNATKIGGDPERIYLSGWSSGGHLAAAALTGAWHGELGLPSSAIKAVLFSSGMYDLRGPRLSARSSYVTFDDATEQALSPQRHVDRIGCPVIVAHGSLDSPEFQRQSREFAMALERAGKPVKPLFAEPYNHFELFETLANPYGVLGRAALEQMKLAP